MQINQQIINNKTLLVSPRQRTMSSSTFGQQSCKPTACTRRTRQCTSTAASSRLCPTALEPDRLREMEIWWLLKQKNLYCQSEAHHARLKASCLPFSSCQQSSAGLVEAAIAPGVLPSANTAVNKKVSAWLQQSHHPDTCAQGIRRIFSKAFCVSSDDCGKTFSGDAAWVIIGRDHWHE